jgi:hypothetical protein
MGGFCPWCLFNADFICWAIMEVGFVPEENHEQCLSLCYYEPGQCP